jgi:hypothetical protein
VASSVSLFEDAHACGAAQGWMFDVGFTWCVAASLENTRSQQGLLD